MKPELPHTSIKQILWGKRELEARVRELALEISRDYNRLEQPLVAIGLLKGAFVFMADLLRELLIPVEADFIRISSYGNKREPGEIRFVADQNLSIRSRDILIVEDIVDTGQTLSFLADQLKSQGALSVRFCALIDKPIRRERAVKLDYVGFCYSGEEFLVGYGLDYAERFRNLPYIATLSLSEIQSDL